MANRLGGRGAAMRGRLGAIVLREAACHGDACAAQYLCLASRNGSRELMVACVTHSCCRYASMHPVPALQPYMHNNWLHPRAFVPSSRREQVTHLAGGPR